MMMILMMMVSSCLFDIFYHSRDFAKKKLTFSPSFLSLFLGTIQEVTAGEEASAEEIHPAIGRTRPLVPERGSAGVVGRLHAR
jgi:hypothetical protein